MCNKEIAKLRRQISIWGKQEILRMKNEENMRKEKHIVNKCKDRGNKIPLMKMVVKKLIKKKLVLELYAQKQDLDVRFQ